MKKLVAILVMGIWGMSPNLVWADQSNPLEYLGVLLKNAQKLDCEVIAWNKMEEVQATSPEMFAKLLPKSFGKCKLLPPGEGLKYKTYKVTIKVAKEYQEVLGKKVKLYVSINYHDEKEIWVGLMYQGLTEVAWTQVE